MSHRMTEPAEERTRPQILVVEDDNLQAIVLAAGLEAAGFEVDTVSSGLEAVWKAQEHLYDVLVIDYQIPEIDGLATARLVRDLMGPIARPVLIALTISPEPLKARANEEGTGFDLVLGKSNDLSPLLATIGHCLESVPDIPTRRAAADALLEQAWIDCDSGQVRPGAHGDDPGPARILVVEDDESEKLVLASVMRNRGYVVETTSNGLEAIRRIRNECYDLVLVDYNLPEIDGLAVVKLTHNLMDQARRPRLIAVTATPGGLRGAEADVDVMFDEIVGKSSDFDGLVNTVDRHLRSAPNPATRRAAEAALPLSRPA
jgi:CheY-like chemotaxis protein